MVKNEKKHTFAINFSYFVRSMKVNAAKKFIRMSLSNNSISSFEDLVTKYQQAVYWHIRRLVVDHEDAQDVMQETFIKAFRAFDQIREVTSSKAWLMRIATNEALTFLSKRKDENVSIDENEMLTATLKEQVYIDFDNEMAVKFQEALLTLTPQQRAVFNLKYYDELNYEEIAEATGTKPETAKVSYHYAKQKITDYINNH